MKVSGGVVLCRRKNLQWEILLLHSGGPLYARRDDGAWTIPKGEVEPGEEPMEAAWREFTEETGLIPPAREKAVPLAPLAVTPGKILYAWLVEGEADLSRFRSATFVWKGHAFPEADRAAWFSLEQSLTKLFRGQAPLVASIQQALWKRPGPD